MKIIKGFPPNIDSIKLALGIYPDTLYCFGDTIYYPEGKEVPDDVQVHEKVHIEQQNKYSSPEVWWTKYLLDKEFRLEQELEAYALQYKWVREQYEDHRAHAECLFEISDNLRSPRYKLGISFGQAESKIRRKYKKMI